MASAGFFIKDDRKRISELNEMGYEIVGQPCDKRCGTNHSSGIFMRKLVNRPKRIVYEYDLIDGVRVPRPTEVYA